MEWLIHCLLRNTLYALPVFCIVVLVRMLLVRAPKVFSYMLWAVVFFRLLCPVSFNSEWSIIPDFEHLISAESRHENVEETDNTVADLYISENEQGFSAAAVTDVQTANEHLPLLASSGKGDIDEMSLLFAVWSGGAAVAVAWYAVSWLKLRRRIATATRIGANIYESDKIATAFVNGILRPKIYVPCRLGESEYEYIVAHERTHIKRCDHIFKALAFLTVIIHWFNPVAWLSLSLMCRDMEQSCDESVVELLGSEIKAKYSRMLLDFNVAKVLLPGAAFGESSAKKRIKNVLNYKKPTALCVVVSFVTVLVISVVCTGSNQFSKDVSSASEVQSAVTQEQEAPSTVRAPLMREPKVDPEMWRAYEESEIEYDEPDFGEPKIVITTSGSICRSLNISHIADKDVYIDWGDGKIVRLSAKDKTAGRNIKIYCEGNIEAFFCYDNAISQLDVSNCPELTTLFCNGNELQSLDVSNCKRLEELDCSGNKLESLNVSGCIALTELICENNRLRVLNLSENRKLKRLDCSSNLLNQLNVSRNTKLESLICSANKISVLNLSNNNALTEVYCYSDDFSEVIINDKSIVCDMLLEIDITELS